MVGERANALRADGDVELVAPAGGLAGLDAIGEVGAEGDGFGRGDADYVLAFGVGGRGRLGGGVDGVAEDLDDGFRVLVFEFGEGAEAGAAAVEAEGGDGVGGDGDEGEDEEGSEGGGRMHSNVIKKGLSWRPGRKLELLS